MPRRRALAFVWPSAADVMRRTLSFLVALVGLILLLPVLAVIALAVKLTSRGPILYTQTRIGINRRRRLLPGTAYRATDRGGKPFTIYKFRTMVPNGQAAATTTEIWATPDDPRVTKLGRILRLYRLDELPQLFNVLIGDMDIVGPRPEQPSIFVRLRCEIERYQERQQVRPGITGWAQINQQYDRSLEDVKKKLAYDLEYVRERSLKRDVEIMLRTFGVIARKQGAW
jgi:lipopolysaccharide/colanic/teichoic acid biosynthesis glycosyltransferase